MRMWPITIMGRTLAVLLLGFLVVGSIMEAHLHVERQAMLSDIGGWHVVSRIAGVVKAMNDIPASSRNASLRAYQGPAFRIVWSPESPLPESSLDWRERLVKDALLSQLGDLPNDGLRIGGAILPDHGGMSGMMKHMYGQDELPNRRAMVISLMLQDNTWLSFATPPAPTQPQWHSRLFWPGALLLLVVVAASVWAVRRATHPLSTFARAAERLGLDFNAKPLEEEGPREVHRAAKAFNLMQRRLQAFIKDRTHMLAAISHDLRTPITRLRLRAEFIKDEEQRIKMLGDLDEMEAMIAATLQFARDDAANEPSQTFDLVELVRDLVGGVGKEGTVTCSLPETLLFTGRPLGLRRLIGNLLGNALRFGSQVEVNLNSTDDTVTLVLRDNGPGIPAEMLDRVFDPFVRVEGSRSRDTGGTGLGLAAVKAIAQAHAGKVELKNLEKGGLEARVTLPKF